MIKFSKEKVLLLHKLIAEETGGSIGVRDEALLESALENVFSGFGGQEFYPTKEEKGARLGYALISNHAFVDGNKRIGMYVMLTFLEVNGIRLDCTNDEVVEVGLAVASGAMDYEALLAWVRAHRVRPSFDPEHEKSRQGWTETTENSLSEWRQKAQIGAEMTPICA